MQTLELDKLLERCEQSDATALPLACRILRAVQTHMRYSSCACPHWFEKSVREILNEEKIGNDRATLEDFLSRNETLDGPISKACRLLRAVQLEFAANPGDPDFDWLAIRLERMLDDERGGGE